MSAEVVLKNSAFSCILSFVYCGVNQIAHAGVQALDTFRHIFVGSWKWQSNEPWLIASSNPIFEETSAVTTVAFDTKNRVSKVDQPSPQEEYSQEALAISDELDGNLPIVRAVCALVD